MHSTTFVGLALAWQLLAGTATGERRSGGCTESDPLYQSFCSKWSHCGTGCVTDRRIKSDCAVRKHYRYYCKWDRPPPPPPTSPPPTPPPPMPCAYPSDVCSISTYCDSMTCDVNTRPHPPYTFTLTFFGMTTMYIASDTLLDKRLLTIPINELNAVTETAIPLAMSVPGLGSVTTFFEVITGDRNSTYMNLTVSLKYRPISNSREALVLTTIIAGEYPAPGGP